MILEIPMKYSYIITAFKNKKLALTSCRMPSKNYFIGKKKIQLNIYPISDPEYCHFLPH